MSYMRLHAWVAMPELSTPRLQRRAYALCVSHAPTCVVRKLRCRTLVPHLAMRWRGVRPMMGYVPHTHRLRAAVAQ